MMQRNNRHKAAEFCPNGARGGGERAGASCGLPSAVKRISAEHGSSFLEGHTPGGRGWAK